MPKNLKKFTILHKSYVGGGGEELSWDISGIDSKISLLVCLIQKVQLMIKTKNSISEETLLLETAITVKSKLSNYPIIKFIYALRHFVNQVYIIRRPQ